MFRMAEDKNFNNGEKIGIKKIVEGSGEEARIIEIPIFVKWAGGKYQLLEQYKPLFPKTVTRYFEPFIGGGAVFFYANQKYEPTEIYLSDTNKDLINVYTQIRDNVEVLVELLKEHKAKHSKEYYYEARNSFNKEIDILKRTAYLIYLNRTCFNGLYRVNSKGEFNVPFGKYDNPAIIRQHTLEKVNKILQGVDIRVQDFEAIGEQVREGDFIYFDPPYHPLNHTSSFTSYTETGFTEADQTRLATLFKILDEKGCKVMLSNSDTELIRNLYTDYDIRTVMARRVISCKGEGRGAISELVVRNY